MFVGDGLFDVAFDDAAPHVCGVGGVSGVPFVVFAHVDEACVGIGVEAAARRCDIEFVDAGLGVADELEEACGVLHVGVWFLPSLDEKDGRHYNPRLREQPIKLSIYFGATGAGARGDSRAGAPTGRGLRFWRQNNSM